MNDAPKPNWTPDPQLLAAFFDGELEGRDDLMDMRARIAVWLEQHPEAADDWTTHQNLQKLWLTTTPVEPTPTTWNQTLDRIDAKRRQPIAPPGRKLVWLALGVFAASILVVVGLLVGAFYFTPPATVKNEPVVVTPRVPPKMDDVEVFAVATEDEVVVFRVAGADTGLLVVGQLPVTEPLELAEEREVLVVRIRPDAKDKMMPTVRQGEPNRPMMIWAKLDTE